MSASRVASMEMLDLTVLPLDIQGHRRGKPVWSMPVAGKS